MKAALTLMRPGENAAVYVIDFNGDLDGLLRPHLGADYEHLQVRRGENTADMWISADHQQPVNEAATRLASERTINGPAVMLEQICWANHE
jgi:hypothetical protein